MEFPENALPAAGSAKPAQTPPVPPDISCRDRAALAGALGFCLLLTDTLLWHGPGAGLTAAVFGWYALAVAYLGRGAVLRREQWLPLVYNLLLSCTMALGSGWVFRVWNLLALAVLVSLHTAALSGSCRQPWWRAGMVGERLGLLLSGLFGQLRATAAALLPAKGTQTARRWLPVALGTAGALALLGILAPLLASGDALFAAATASLRAFLARCFTDSLWKLLTALVLTPFVFGLLYRLRHPKSRPQPAKRPAPAADALGFLIILAALDGLYLLFLAVQSAGLFGGADYLAQRGLSYAQWARSGFFQMVGVTAVNLTVLLTALTAARQTGRAWTLLRILSAGLTAESFLLLVSAAWRMTLYVSAYGLSFLRCMTYWGMGMMALFFAAAVWKLLRPDRAFLRAAIPTALAGWLLLSCVPIDALVARNQVDRYLSGESGSIDLTYLLYDLSYDALGQLERLEGHVVLDSGGADRSAELRQSIAQQRAAAAAECARWETWSLSACLASDF